MILVDWVKWLIRRFKKKPKPVKPGFVFISPASDLIPSRNETSE